MKKYKVKFGMEFEFMGYRTDESLYDPTIYSLPKGWLHTREYYRGMQEIMSKPYNLTYKNLNKVIRDAIKTIKNVSKDNECVIPLYSRIMVMYNGIISNGVHIHLSIYNEDGKNILYEPYIEDSLFYISAAMLNYIEKSGQLGIRSAFSHHIYGAHRDSEYSFKRNSRFAPIIISPKKNRKPRTLEIRVFDFEHILNQRFIWNVLKKVIKSVIKVYEAKSIGFKSEYSWLLDQPMDLESAFSIIYNEENFDDYSLDWDYLEKAVNVYEKWKKVKKYIFVNGKINSFMERKVNTFESIKEIL